MIMSSSSNKLYMTLTLFAHSLKNRREAVEFR